MYPIQPTGGWSLNPFGMNPIFSPPMQKNTFSDMGKALRLIEAFIALCGEQPKNPTYYLSASSMMLFHGEPLETWDFDPAWAIQTLSSASYQEISLLFRRIPPLTFPPFSAGSPLFLCKDQLRLQDLLYQVSGLIHHPHPLASPVGEYLQGAINQLLIGPPTGQQKDGWELQSEGIKEKWRIAHQAHQEFDGMEANTHLLDSRLVRKYLYNGTSELPHMENGPETIVLTEHNGADGLTQPQTVYLKEIEDGAYGKLQKNIDLLEKEAYEECLADLEFLSAWWEENPSEKQLHILTCLFLLALKYGDAYRVGYLGETLKRRCAGGIPEAIAKLKHIPHDMLLQLVGHALAFPENYRHTSLAHALIEKLTGKMPMKTIYIVKAYELIRCFEVVSGNGWNLVLCALDSHQDKALKKEIHDTFHAKSTLIPLGEQKECWKTIRKGTNDAAGLDRLLGSNYSSCCQKAMTEQELAQELTLLFSSCLIPLKKQAAGKQKRDGMRIKAAFESLEKTLSPDSYNEAKRALGMIFEDLKLPRTLKEDIENLNERLKKTPPSPSKHQGWVSSLNDVATRAAAEGQGTWEPPFLQLLGALETLKITGYDRLKVAEALSGSEHEAALQAGMEQLLYILLNPNSLYPPSKKNTNAKKTTQLPHPRDRFKLTFRKIIFLENLPNATCAVIKKCLGVREDLISKYFTTEEIGAFHKLLEQPYLLNSLMGSISRQEPLSVVYTHLEKYVNSGNVPFGPLVLAVKGLQARPSPNGQTSDFFDIWRCVFHRLRTIYKETGSDASFQLMTEMLLLLTSPQPSGSDKNHNDFFQCLHEELSQLNELDLTTKNKSDGSYHFGSIDPSKFPFKKIDDPAKLKKKYNKLCRNIKKLRIKYEGGKLDLEDFKSQLDCKFDASFALYKKHYLSDSTYSINIVKSLCPPINQDFNGAASSSYFKALINKTNEVLKFLTLSHRGLKAADGQDSFSYDENDKALFQENRKKALNDLLNCTIQWIISPNNSGRASNIATLNLISTWETGRKFTENHVEQQLNSSKPKEIKDDIYSIINQSALAFLTQNPHLPLMAKKQSNTLYRTIKLSLSGLDNFLPFFNDSKKLLFFRRSHTVLIEGLKEGYLSANLKSHYSKLILQLTTALIDNENFYEGDCLYFVLAEDLLIKSEPYLNAAAFSLATVETLRKKIQHTVEDMPDPSIFGYPMYDTIASINAVLTRLEHLWENASPSEDEFNHFLICLEVMAMENTPTAAISLIQEEGQ